MQNHVIMLSSDVITSCVFRHVWFLDSCYGFLGADISIRQALLQRDDVIMREPWVSGHAGPVEGFEHSTQTKF